MAAVWTLSPPPCWTGTPKSTGPVGSPREEVSSLRRRRPDSSFSLFSLASAVFASASFCSSSSRDIWLLDEVFTNVSCLIGCSIAVSSACMELSSTWLYGGGDAETAASS